MKHFLHKFKVVVTIVIICLFANTTTAQYCTPSYITGTSDGDYIDRVVLGSIDNTTGDDGGLDYVDYTSLSTDLVAGSSYDLTVYNCPDWSEAIEAWIDYNQDGIFDDDESIGCAVLAVGASSTYTFTVPSSALDGSTTMRVMCEYLGPCGLDPCSITYTWGQAEDYTINISGGGGAVEGCTNPDALNYDADASVDDGSCILPYTIVTCDYSSSIMESGGTELILGDDVVSSSVPLGFTFPFYGTDYTECYVSSNGYLSFTSTTLSGCCTGQVLPTADYPNSIFFGQEDLDPDSGVDGVINYYTTGDPGSQIFLLTFDGVPHYPGPTGTFPVTVQVQLYEATGEIRIVTTEYNGDGGASTMGLNLDGDIAQAVAGRNSADWSAYDDCVSFLPYGTEVEACDATVGPGGLFADEITAIGATLNWDEVPSASKYIVTIFEADDMSTKKRRGVFSNSLTILTSLEPETTYGFRVKTVCYTDDEISPFSDTYYFTTAPLKEGEIARLVKMYPNPNNGTFRLELGGYENKMIEVFVTNAVGQVVYQNTLSINEFTHVEEISLGGIASGMYQLKIVDGETISNENLVIE
ncbi:MAG: GEVED domain-containing protein [Chitinophagales bacterium]